MAATMCMLCKQRPATGWENGWRLKVCEECANQTHWYGDGLPLDYSPFVAPTPQPVDDEKGRER